MKTPDRGALAAPDFKPTPAQIDVSAEHFWSAFGHHETEVSARWLCRMAQERGDWRAFHPADAQEFYAVRMDGERFTYNRLIERGTGHSVRTGRYLTGGGWIVERDGLLHFTEEFVLRCYLSSTGKSKELRERFPEESEPREYF